MVVMAPENRHRTTDGRMKGAALTAAEKRRAAEADKNSDEYRRRRERNNLAVKKSRNKSKQKTQETLERVNKLKAENEMLEAKIKLLSKELSFLKDLFLAHAGNAHGQSLQDMDLSMFTDETENNSGGSGSSTSACDATANAPKQGKRQTAVRIKKE